MIENDALADALRPALLKLSRQVRREAQKIGVSALDAHLIAIIAKHPGIGVSELAAIEQMSSPSMSAHVKRLVEAGWLDRGATIDGDRRRVQLVPTEKASRFIAALRKRRNDWLAARIALLSDDERAALAAAIEPMARLVEVAP